jgi:hypothetical protein
VCLVLDRPQRFIVPILLLRTDKLPEGAGCRYEVNLDGDSRGPHTSNGIIISI